MGARTLNPKSIVYEEDQRGAILAYVPSKRK